jgi:hypothetical protein
MRTFSAFFFEKITTDKRPFQTNVTRAGSLLTLVVARHDEFISGLLDRVRFVL